VQLVGGVGAACGGAATLSETAHGGGLPDAARVIEVTPLGGAAAPASRGTPNYYVGNTVSNCGSFMSNALPHEGVSATAPLNHCTPRRKLAVVSRRACRLEGR
jgi:hypothetical protein